MKFFRSSRGETYVAQPPAVIDPTPGRSAAAQTRTAIRPAPTPGAASPTESAGAPGRHASPATAAALSAPAARSVADTAQDRRIPDAAPHERARAEAPAATPAPVASARASAPAARSGTASSQAAAAQNGSDQWERRPPQPLSIASHQLAIDLARGGDPVPGLARRFPHVLNQLSAVWGDLPVAAELIDDLLVDRRGGRRGFPADVLAELLTIRRFAVKRMVGQPRKPPKAPGPG
jgi:hypothetical protein